jgi:hypothetical protein
VQVVGNVIVRWRWWWWRRLIEDLVVQWSFAPLLAEDFEVVLHLCEHRSLFVDVLSMSFNTLNCNLPSQNGFMFLPEPLYLLLLFPWEWLTRSSFGGLT